MTAVTPNRSRSIAHLTAHLTAGLALVVSLGGGAYAAGLAKDSVKSKHLRSGAVRTVDLAAGAVTGAKVVDGSITGADIDESTLVLPQPEAAEAAVPPAVYASTKSAGTLADHSTKIAEITIIVPEAGYLDATATMMLNGAAGSDIIDVFVMNTGVEVARGYFDAGDVDGMFDMAQSAHGVVPIAAGRHTIKYFAGEYTTGGHSAYEQAQLILRYFPEGDVA